MPGIALRRGTSKSAPRRAVARWAWRIFRREWRQQVLVLCLLGIAVAATTFGVALATNGAPRGQTTVTLSGSDPKVPAAIAAIRAGFGSGEVVEHRPVRVPG